ncbi:MAG: SPASM domain-containing protein [Anaerolineae bacterium]
MPRSWAASGRPWGIAHLSLAAGRGGVGKPFFCGAGLTRCSIMPNGDVLGCQQVYDAALAEGNIRQQPLSCLWRQRFQRFRQPGRPSSCRDCTHWPGCRGGCWAEQQTRGSCLRSDWVCLP